MWKKAQVLSTDMENGPSCNVEISAESSWQNAIWKKGATHVSYIPKWTVQEIGLLFLWTFQNCSKKGYQSDDVKTTCSYQDSVAMEEVIQCKN